ncbi:MAG: response regulator [Proteobacteria bacterium]|nr:response regulator [Pseudomonadota bacterium]MBU1717025.1 response regulator [Pseudomonadota bacterium]
MKVLVVEDNENSRVLLESALEASGYEVVSAENGRLALEIAQLTPPDLIISDILMPEMDGYALCRAIKAEEALRTIPFIFYTATYTDPSDERFAMELGASRFIIKPMEMEPFLTEIKKVLAEHQTARLTVPEQPLKNDRELQIGHAAILSRKLDKKVHDLKEESHKLKTSQERYRRLVEALRNDYFFYAHYPDGKFFYISPSITEVLGYSQEEFLVQYTEYLTDDPAKHNRLKGERISPYELMTHHRNGGLRYLEVSEIPVFDKQGQVLSVEGIAHDITKRKQIEQELKKTQDSLQKAQQIAHLGNLDWNLITDELWWSDEIYRILGLEPNAFAATYESFLSHIHPDDKEFVVKSIEKAMTAGGTYNIDHRIILKDGCERIVSEQGVITFDESSGKPVRMVGTIQDITERKRMEEEREILASQLRQAQKMESIGTLAGGIAHDFNNILTPILGYTEIVMQSLPADSENSINLREVLNAGLRAKDLVKQILTFSRSSGEEREPVALQPIIKESLKLLRSSLPTTIKIHENVDPDCSPILANPTQIHQILMNLCTNAYQAMRNNGGKLTVSLSDIELGPDDYVGNINLQPGKYLRLEVSDTGPGINPTLQEKIFEPYFTTKAHGEGTGLGLSVVHGIVKNHGGHITLYSEPNQGTTFHIYLPKITTTAFAAQPEAKGEIIGGTESILLVDDEEAIVKLEKTILENLGYRVTALTSSTEAMEFFKEAPRNIDLVITDMTMPTMTGAELSQKLLKIRPDIPIILCSGFSEIINEAKAKSLGVREYAMKPLLRKDIAKIVRRVLDEQ